MGGLGFCGVWAFWHGNDAKILYGNDGAGNVCGTGVTADYPYVYFAQIAGVNNTNSTIDEIWRSAVCVKACTSG